MPEAPSDTTPASPPTTSAKRRWLTLGSVAVLLVVVFFMKDFREGFMWPLRVLTAASLGWLLHVAFTFVRTTRFEAKKVVFTLIMGALFYGALHLVCHVFLKLMSAKDEQLLTVDATSLTNSARSGIRAMLEGNSPVQYDREIGWVHRPGYQWEGHSITSQGLRGTRLYPETPPDPEKRILCVGDSFVFGYEVPDGGCFPSQGEQLAPGTVWINLGICGGGLTHALLQYRRNAPRFGGKHVVIGFMTDNQKRTVNCFRGFVSRSGAMTPLTQPYAKFTGGRLTIEPNPFQDISDYQRLLADEPKVLAELHALDYATWSHQHASSNPVLRTLHYVMDRGEINRNLDRLFDRKPDGMEMLGLFEAPYGNAIWHPDSLAFKANTALFDLFYSEVIADGRKPLIVILPSARDVELCAKGSRPKHARLLEHLKEKGHRHFDFLDSLERRHSGGLDPKKFYVNTHFNAETNRFLAEEIIRALDLK